MFTSTDLKAIITTIRPIIERQLDDAEVIAGHREKVTAQGGDWSQVKALVKAMILDERDDAGGHKRIMTILHKADNALGYADMLGLGNLNEKNSFGDDGASEEDTGPAPHEQPPHDPVTGEIIEPDDESESPKHIVVTEPAPTAPQLSAAAAGSDPASKADDAKEPPQAEASSATQSTAAERRSAETDATLVVMPHADGSIGSERHGESVPVDTLNPGGENANGVGNADAPHSPDDAAVEKKPSRQAHNLETAGASPAPATISETPGQGAPAATGTAHNPIPVAVPGSIRTEKTPVEGLEWHSYLRVWPELFGREFAALVDDVRANGVTKPIIMQGNIVLDGRARYLAARQAGVSYTVEEYAGDDPLRDIIAWNMEARKPHLVARGFIAKALIKLVPDRADEIADLLDLSQQREAAE